MLCTAGDGEHVAGSPCRVQVTPGAPSARHSSVAGPGRSSAVAGCRAEFTVTFRDAFGNPFSCSSSTAASIGPDSTIEVSQHWSACKGDVSSMCSTCDVAKSARGINLVHPRYVLCCAVHCCAQVQLVGSNSLAAAVAEVTPLPLGGFCCSYVAPATPGLYVLEVVTAAGGKHVGGSPFSVRVRTVVLGRHTRLAAASSLSWLSWFRSGPYTPVAPPALGFDPHGAACPCQGIGILMTSHA